MVAVSKRVLVTGADGFIGSHLVESLLSHGHEVRAFVLYNSFDSWGWLDDLPDHLKKNLDVRMGDIRDPTSIRSATVDCNIVLHLAALIAIPYSYVAPTTYVETNVQGTLNVLQAARDVGVERIIHTSTSEVYGSAVKTPMTENHPLQAQSPYAATKIGADQLALSFYRSFECPVVVLRPFNTFGPRQSTRAVIPTVITQIASGLDSIKLGSTTPTRDFNFVRDIVSAFCASIDAPDLEGEVINVGSGYEISIGDTVALIANLMGSSVEVCSEESRIRPAGSEVVRLCADNNKAQTLLSLKPKNSAQSAVVPGMKETIEWFSQPKNLEKYKVGKYTL
mgnify:CR=1 FL=1